MVFPKSTETTIITATETTSTTTASNHVAINEQKRLRVQRYNIKDMCKCNARVTKPLALEDVEESDWNTTNEDTYWGDKLDLEVRC